MKKFFSTVFILTSFELMSQVEQQNFKTLNIIDNIEIREYPPTIYASVTIKNSNNKENKRARWLVPLHWRV